MMRIFLLLVMVLPVPALAGDFAARHPAGSIQDAAAAQAALKDVDAEMAQIARDARARDAECHAKILVNACRDDVRRSKELAEREVRRVRVEARDLQRRIEAERVAKRRGDDTAARAAEDAQRPQREEKARAASQAREAAVKQRDEAAAKGVEAGRTPGSESERKSPAKDRLTVAERAENARKFQEKQALAQQRAQRQEAERKENEQRRAKRREQIEQREAERETIRRKAGGLLGN